MNLGAAQLHREVLAYFGLVALLTVPFWVAASLVRMQLMPGLSIAALAVVVPMVSGAIVSAEAGGRTAVGALFTTLVQPGARMIAVGVVASLAPAGAAGLSWLSAGAPDWAALKPTILGSMLAVFLIAALAEELGWTAFAAHRLLRGGLASLPTGLAVGMVWAIWHVPALIELGRSAEWICWWSLWTVAQRVIMVSLYIRGRSWMWGPILFHASTNMFWQLAPKSFDPRIEGLAMVAAAILAAAAAWRRAD